MAYRISAIPMTLSDLQGHPSVASPFQMCIFRTTVQQLERFQRALCECGNISETVSDGVTVVAADH